MEPPHNIPRHPPWARPEPSTPFRVNTYCFLAFSTWLTVQAASNLIDPQGPGPAMTGLFCTPVFALLGICQAVATFARSAAAARTTAIASFLLGALFALSAIAMLIDLASGGRTAPPAWVILQGAGFAAYTLFTGTLNLRRAEELRRPPPPGLCLTCGYDLRATPDRCPECGTVPNAPV